MTQQADTCEVTMQPWNNWRGALEVKLSDGSTVVLNDNQYTSDSPVHEVYTVPGTVTDLWWAKDQNGNWYEDSHYTVTNCTFDQPYHSVPGKQPSVKINVGSTPSTTIPPTTSTSEDTTTTTTTNPTEPPTFVVASDPLPPTITSVSVTPITPQELPNTGADAFLLLFLAIGFISSGVAVLLKRKEYK